MPHRLVVLGAGGFGREVLDVVNAINSATDTAAYEVLGVLDDSTPDPEILRSYRTKHLGPIDAIVEMDSDVQYVIAVGSPQARRAVDLVARRGARSSPVLIHPSAWVGPVKVELGPGSIVCANASLTNHIRVGRHVHINLNCTVGHDTRLDDFVTLSPLSAISGNVHAQTGAFLGTGSKVNPGLVVGRDAVVGTGAAVVRDVADGVTVVGVPARPI